MNKKRFIRSILIAWILFIGIDFVIHAAILENLWAEQLSAIKSALDLAILIPVGYFSFFLLTLLIGWLFVKIYKDKSSLADTFYFGIIFGLLFAGSNLTALFSYVNIPLKNLILYNIGYFVEILVVTYSIHKTYYGEKQKRHMIISLVLFFTLIFTGILIQNLML